MGRTWRSRLFPVGRWNEGYDGHRVFPAGGHPDVQGRQVDQTVSAERESDGLRSLLSQFNPVGREQYSERLTYGMTCGVRAAGLRAVLDSRLRGNDDWDRFFLAVIPAKAGIQRRAGMTQSGSRTYVAWP